MLPSVGSKNHPLFTRGVTWLEASYRRDPLRLSLLAFYLECTAAVLLGSLRPPLLGPMAFVGLGCLSKLLWQVPVLLRVFDNVGLFAVGCFGLGTVWFTKVVWLVPTCFRFFVHI